MNVTENIFSPKLNKKPPFYSREATAKCDTYVGLVFPPIISYWKKRKCYRKKSVLTWIRTIDPHFILEKLLQLHVQCTAFYIPARLIAARSYNNSSLVLTKNYFFEKRTLNSLNVSERYLVYPEHARINEYYRFKERKKKFQTELGLHQMCFKHCIHVWRLTQYLHT